jgi:RNA polymerase sigma-32 factor
MATLSRTNEPSFSHYVTEVKQIARLTEEQEVHLFTKIIEDGCKNSIDKIITSNLRFVIHCAYKFRHYKLPIADLVSEGNIGLMRAIQTYSLKHDVRFVTYASKWINASMYNYITSNTGVVKFVTSKPKRKIFFNRGKLRDSMGDLKPLMQISREFNVPIKDIQSYLSYAQQAASLYNEEGEVIEIPDRNNNITQLITDEYHAHQTLKLNNALACLDARELDIITNRFLTEEKLTLIILAGRHNISLERVRQLEKQSLIKMRNVMLNM